MKRRSAKSNKQVRRSSRVSMDQEMNEVCDSLEHSALDKPTDAQIDGDLKFFKTVVVSKQTTEAIKQKLLTTIDRRREMIKTNNQLDFLENFPFFFTHPEFVRMI